MSDFRQLVEWLRDRQGQDPDVEETTYGWRLSLGDLRVEWDLHDDFTFHVINRGTAKQENLTLEEVKDEILGWFT